MVSLWVIPFLDSRPQGQSSESLEHHECQPQVHPTALTGLVDHTCRQQTSFPDADSVMLHAGNKQQASSPATSGHDAPSSAPAGVRTEATRSPTPAQTPSRGPPPCKPSARPSLDPVQPDIAETLQGLPPLIPAVVEEHSGLGPEATAPESPQLQSASATTAHSSGRQGVPQGEAQGTQGPATVRNDQQSRQSSEAAAPPVQSLGKAQAGQKPTYQASAAASNAILLAQDVKPVAAALKPSKVSKHAAQILLVVPWLTCRPVPVGARCPSSHRYVLMPLFLQTGLDSI